jgi:hypothetical protein
MMRPAVTATPPARALIAAVLMLLPAAAQAAPDLSGFWWIKDRSQTIKDGARIAPLTPAGAALYAANQKAAAAGQPVPAGQHACLPEGIPRLMMARYPFQILQRPEQVTFLHERQHMVRLIYMDQTAPPDDVDPAYNGYSTGAWDGDALVVRTSRFNDATALDATGLPHSDKLALVERFTVTGDGQTLRDQVTVDDPADYTHPWSFTLEFAKQTGVRLMEDVCTYGPPARDAAKR